MAIADSLRPGGVLALDLCDLEWAASRVDQPSRGWVGEDWAVTEFSVPPRPVRARMATFIREDGGSWRRDDERRQRDGRHLARAGPARRARCRGDRRPGVRGRVAARRPPCHRGPPTGLRRRRLASEPERRAVREREVHRSNLGVARGHVHRQAVALGSEPRRRTGSPAIATLAIPVTSTSWRIAVRPGCRSAGTSQVMKNGSPASRASSSMPAPRHRSSTPSGRLRAPASTCSPSRWAVTRARYPTGRRRTTGLARHRTTPGAPARAGSSYQLRDRRRR